MAETTADKAAEEVKVGGGHLITVLALHQSRQHRPFRLSARRPHRSSARPLRQALGEALPASRASAMQQDPVGTPQQLQLQLTERRTTEQPQRRSARQSTSQLCSWKRLRPAQGRRMRRHSQNCEFDNHHTLSLWGQAGSMHACSSGAASGSVSTGSPANCCCRGRQAP